MASEQEVYRNSSGDYDKYPILFNACFSLHINSILSNAITMSDLKILEVNEILCIKTWIGQVSNKKCIETFPRE